MRIGAISKKETILSTSHHHPSFLHTTWQGLISKLTTRLGSRKGWYRKFTNQIAWFPVSYFPSIRPVQHQTILVSDQSLSDRKLNVSKWQMQRRGWQTAKKRVFCFLLMMEIMEIQNGVLLIFNSSCTNTRSTCCCWIFWHYSKIVVWWISYWPNLLGTILGEYWPFVYLVWTSLTSGQYSPSTALNKTLF